MQLSDKECFICGSELIFSKSGKYSFYTGRCKNSKCKKHNFFDYKVYVDNECSWCEIKINNYIVEKVIKSGDDSNYPFRIFIKKQYKIPYLILNINNLTLTADYLSNKIKIENIISLSQIYG